MEYSQVKGKTEEELHKEMRAVGIFSGDILHASHVAFPT
jgi:hypothetical protein